MESYERLYVEYLYYFNVERDYFECHEVLEELWLEKARDPLYQGLLQVAVGLYHFRNDNLSGAVKLFTGALEKLGPYPDTVLGIDLGKLKEEVRVMLHQLQNSRPSPPSFYDLDILILDPALEEQVHALKLHPPQKHEE